MVVDGPEAAEGPRDVGEPRPAWLGGSKELLCHWHCVRQWRSHHCLGSNAWNQTLIGTLEIQGRVADVSQEGRQHCE